MNLQKFRMRDMQKQRTLVRQDNPLEMLQAEADKIQKWQLKMEFKMKEKEGEITASKQTIESMRKIVLDSKIENEKKVKQLQEEIKSHDVCLKKCEATRQLCNLVKDELHRLEKASDEFADVAHQLRGKNDKQNMTIQKLADDFSTLTVSMKEAGEVWKTEHAKLVDSTRHQIDVANAELKEVKSELQIAKDDVNNKCDFISKLEAELRESQNQRQKLAKARRDLQQIVAELLQTIGEMKTSNEFAVKELRAQLSEATNLVQEKSEMVRQLNEQYVDAKQTWQKLEVEYQGAVKSGESKCETLWARCEELQVEKDELAKDLKTSIAGNVAVEEKLAGVIAEAEEYATEKERFVQKLQNELQQRKSKEETLSSELESCRNLAESALEVKEKKIQELSSENEKLKEAIAEMDENLKMKSGELNGSDKEVKSKQKEIEKLKKDISKLEDEIKRLKSQADDTEQLQLDLDKIREDSASEAKRVKKLNDNCKQWEKKTKEVTDAMKEACEEADALKKEVKSKEIELKSVKKLLKESEKIKEEKEKLSAKLKEKESDCKDEIAKLTEKTNLLEEQQKKDNESIRGYMKEIEFFRQHLKDTEKMLSDEGEKLIKRNDEIDEQRKKIKDLEHEKRKKLSQNAELQKELDKAREQKVSECSLSPSTFQRRKRTQPQINMKEEPKANFDRAKKLPQLEHPVRKRSIRDFLLDDEADDMLSEVSFGSGVVDVTQYPKRQTLKSSTPKPAVCAVNFKHFPTRKTNQAPVKTTKTRPQNFAKTPGNNSRRKPKQAKKETKEDGSPDWFETDSIYGFHD